MTDGWDLPPNCEQEGETFFGIPLSQTSDSKLLSTASFQDQFDFEYLTDRNFTYMKEFGTNHGWLVGETLGNGAGSIVDKDTAHIPIFYTGTTNPDMVSVSAMSNVSMIHALDCFKCNNPTNLCFLHALTGRHVVGESNQNRKAN